MKPLKILILVIGILFALLGCGERARPIRLWHAYRGDEERALAAVLAGWKGTPIEALSVPYDAFPSKLEAAIPLGEGPDLYIDVQNRLGEYRARKIVAPPGDALEREAFSATALEAVSLKGEVYGVPIAQKSVALYINTDIVNEAPADLESLEGMPLPRGVQFPLAAAVDDAYIHAAFLGAFGGRMLGPNDDYEFVGPAAEKSLLLTKELLARGVLPEDADGSLVTSLFASGSAAYAISGPWLANDLGERKNLHYRVVPLPPVRAAGGAPMRPLLTVEAVWLSPDGAKQEEVRRLARLLGSKEAAALRTTQARASTVRVDLPPPSDPLLAAFAKQAETAIPIPSSRAMQAAWEPMSRAIRKVLRGEASIQDALAEGKRRFDDVRLPLPNRASPMPLAFALGALALFLAYRWLRIAKQENWQREIRRSLPAYRYVLHAVVAVGVLVVFPLTMGAVTSLFAGSADDVRYVGLANFISILSARGGPLLASGSFYFVLLVTVLWTIANLALHLGIGVFLALLLARPSLKLKGFYRVLLIVPWAVPSYVTALAWKGMFHRQFGALTALVLALDRTFGLSIQPIAWFSRFSTAFAANVATNAWLGFPFMMVVTLGALTSVPADVLDAAKVDGATRWQRLTLVTLPIIRPTLAPAVTLGAIWTFNMFNVVFLVSGGDPDGTTDILVSEAYRWAFTREAQVGYAAAYAVLIFFLLTFATRVGKKPQEASQPEPPAPPLPEPA